MTFSLGSTPRSLVKYNDKSIAAITEIAASAKDDMVLIKTLTGSSSADLSFVNGASDVVLDNTYPIYVFKCISISNGSNATFRFNVSDDTSSHSYDIAKTTTRFRAFVNEGDGTDIELAYQPDEDLANGTGVQVIASVRSDADSCCAGELWLFNPSSTTFVKHFISSFNSNNAQYCESHHNAGYVNTTAAVTAVQFTMSAGSIAAGTIKMYGIKDS